MIPVPTPNELRVLRRKDQWTRLAVALFGFAPLVAMGSSRVAEATLPSSPWVTSLLLVGTIGQILFAVVVMIWASRVAGDVRVPTDRSAEPVSFAGSTVLKMAGLGLLFGLLVPLLVVGVFLSGAPMALLIVVVMVPVSAPVLVPVVMVVKRNQVVGDLRAGRFERGLLRASRSGWLLGPARVAVEAELHLQSGDLDKASSVLEGALARSATKPVQIQRLLARVSVLREQGRWAEAEADARKAICLMPFLPVPNAVLAEIQLASSQDPRAALDRLEYAVDAQRRSLGVHLADRTVLPTLEASRAWAMALAGLAAEARLALGESTVPDAPLARAGVLWRRARALEALGDADAARRAREEGSRLPGQAARLCAVDLQRHPDPG